jgi:MFS family permease
VLVACILGTAVVTVDSTVVNVALPAIERDLGGGLGGQQWTSNAYLVTLGSLLLLGDSLGVIVATFPVRVGGPGPPGRRSAPCSAR